MADNEGIEEGNETANSEQEEVAADGAVDSDVQEGLEGVAQAADGVAEATKANNEAAEDAGKTIEFILEVPLAVAVEVGRARMTIQDLLQLGQGSVIELEKLAGEPLDIFVNGQRVARGEAVIVNEKFGVRLAEIISPEDRIERLA
jgi:flagellar motor switch protein FliN